jgi:hypothetical protein
MIGLIKDLTENGTCSLEALKLGLIKDLAENGTCSLEALKFYKLRKSQKNCVNIAYVRWYIYIPLYNVLEETGI